MRNIAALLGVASAGLCLSWWWGSPRDSIEFESDVSDSSGTLGESQKLWANASLGEISARASTQHAERVKLADLYPEDYYNPDYGKDDQKQRREYTRKVFRHHAIKTFVTSPDKDKPANRQALIALLENGYDIDDWSHIMGPLISWKLPELAWQQQMLREGFPADEVQSAVEKAQSKKEDAFASFDGGHYPRWSRSLGIDDPELIDELLSLDFEIPSTPQPPGFGIRRALKGERLLSDEDWLDEEFRAAMARYGGESKPSFRDRQLNSEMLTFMDGEGKQHAIRTKPLKIAPVNPNPFLLQNGSDERRSSGVLLSPEE